MISVKEYECPYCLNTSKHSTNHYLEIYTTCKICGGGVQYCIEPEAVKKEPIGFCSLTFYSFNLKLEEDCREYEALNTLLTGVGYNNFDTVEPKSFNSILALKERVESEGIDSIPIYNILGGDLNPQFVTSHGRLHLWREVIQHYAGKKTNKLHGYYITRLRVETPTGLKAIDLTNI
jgi:hypothetical protein